MPAPPTVVALLSLGRRRSFPSATELSVIYHIRGPWTSAAAPTSHGSHSGHCQFIECALAVHFFVDFITPVRIFCNSTENPLRPAQPVESPSLPSMNPSSTVNPSSTEKLLCDDAVQCFFCMQFSSLFFYSSDQEVHQQKKWSVKKFTRKKNVSSKSSLQKNMTFTRKKNEVHLRGVV